jgi:hypothetical protein
VAKKLRKWKWGIVGAAWKRRESFFFLRKRDEKASCQRQEMGRNCQTGPDPIETALY